MFNVLRALLKGLVFQSLIFLGCSHAPANLENDLDPQPHPRAPTAPNSPPYEATAPPGAVLFSCFLAPVRYPVR